MNKIVKSAILIFIIFSPAQIKAQDYRLCLGFGPGYSLGLRERYIEYQSTNLFNGAYERRQENLGINYSICLQYFFKRHLGIQIEFNHQEYTCCLEQNYDPDLENGYTWHESFKLCYVDFIYKFDSSKGGCVSPYFKAGFGTLREKMEWTLIGNGSGSEVQGLVLRIGGGIKYHLFPKIPQLALTLDASYNASMRLCVADNYLAFHLGLEYGIWKMPFQLKERHNSFNRKFVLGVGAGYYFGLEEESNTNEYQANIQYYFTSHWGIKGEMESVSRKYKRSPINLKRKWGANFANINVIYKFDGLGRNRLFPYLSSGFGFSPTAFGTFALKTGLGLKFHPFPQNLPLAFDLGFFYKSFIFVDPALTELADIYINTKNHIGLNLGIEYNSPDLPYESERKEKRSAVGIDSGASLALGGSRNCIFYGFLPLKEKDKYGFNFSFYIQKDLSRNLGVQWEIHYQRGRNYEEIYSEDNILISYYTIRKYAFLFGFINGIYKLNILEKKNFFPYLLGGVGIDMCQINRLGFKTGVGIKYGLFPRKPQLALNFGFFYHTFVGKLPLRYLTSPYEWQIGSGLPSNPNSYLRINIGLEYRF
jgi:hypothetical protein